MNEQRGKFNLEPNTQQITPGMIIKNYYALCELLSAAPLVGDSKKAQLKEWKRYFDWTKDRQKFIITDVYDSPLPKAMRDGTVYAKLIETLLIALLAREEDFTYCATETELLQRLSMINSRYREINKPETYKYMVDIDGLSASEGVSEIAPINYFDFNSRSHKRLKEILYTALNSMVSRKLLVYSKEVVIVVYQSDPLNPKKKTPVQIVATDSQVKDILKIERKVMDEMGAANIFQLFARNKARDYYAKVNEYLKKEFNWNGMFKRLKLIYNQESMLKSIGQTKDMLLQTASLQDIRIDKEKLNAAIIRALNKEAHTRADKWTAEVYEYQKDAPEGMEFKYPEKLARSSYLGNPKYIQDQKFLADYFIKID